VLVEWRSRDLEHTLASGRLPQPADLKWLVAELRLARSALTDILALAYDLDDEESIAVRIRFAANRALGLYDAAPVRSASQSNGA
jgi:hypothetical protein